MGAFPTKEMLTGGIGDDHMTAKHANDRATIDHFFETVYGFKGADQWVTVWQSNPAQTASFLDPAAAAAYVAARPTANIHVGIGMFPEKRPANSRGTAADVTSVAALVADVDYGIDPAAHNQKVGRPKTAEEALRLIHSMPLNPTLVVHSGHGYHAWWVLTEPYEIANEEDRGRIAWTSRLWGQLLKDKAKERGWVVDSVFDLARVLRVPGSHNCKPNCDPVLTQVVEWDGPRLSDIEDLWEWLPAENMPSDFAAAAPQAAIPDDITFDPDDPDVVMTPAIYNLLAAIPEAEQAFKYELKANDDSAADMTLANYAAHAGWSDQEIINLLMLARKLKRGSAKCDSRGNVRADYYWTTAVKARVEAADAEAQVVIESGSGDKSERLQALGTRLGDIVVTRVVRYRTADGGQYYLVVDGKWVSLGGPGDLLNIRHMRAVILDLAARAMPMMKQVKWDRVAEAICTLAEDEDTGAYTSEHSMLVSYMKTWLETQPPVLEDKKAQALTGGGAFFEKGKVYFQPHDLLSYVNTTYTATLKGSKVAQVLRQMGSEPRRVYFYQETSISGDKKRNCRSVWQMPDEAAEMYLAEGTVTE